MKVRILDCSGGIGGRNRTTSMLVDDDMLIDAGTGVGDLSLAELTQIDHVFTTHSHLDHIACIPFMVDTIGEMRDKPLTVYAQQATVEILRKHIFNWAVWPDFTEIPSPEHPYLRFETIRIGQEMKLGQSGRRSSAAAFLLTQRGFRASLLEGGLSVGRQGGSASGNGQGASAS